MNSIRPIVGVLLATLMCAPALAAPVELIVPGGGLPPEKGTPIEAPGIENTGLTDLPSTPKVDIPMVARSSSPDTPEPVLQTRHFGLQVELSCAVASQPNAIAVVNHSAEVLPPGTRIKWQIKSEGKVGYFAIIGPLNGGETLVADNVLQGGADAGAACTARVI